jgi:stage II sporulation protein D
MVLGAASISWSADTAVQRQRNGHARGMSQHGAQGAAMLGIPYEQILSTYYPGTTPTTWTDPRPLRVKITADTDGDVTVAAAPGLEVERGGLTTPLPEALSGPAVTTWRVRTDRRALLLEGRAGSGAWEALPVFGDPSDALAFRSAEPQRLILPGGRQREYRGSLVAVVDPAAGGLRTVNEVSLDDYLLSVVPVEMPPEWLPAALRAQAVAARTYALWHAGHSKGYADICDTTNCQVYLGVRALSAAGKVTRTYEAASSTDAVRATAGRILTYLGRPAFTEFSDSNGGYSRAGDVPYLPARPDPWDGVP